MKREVESITPNGDGTCDILTKDGTLYKNCYPSAIEHKRLMADGCTDIIMRSGEAVSYVNKQGKIIQKKMEEKK